MRRPLVIAAAGLGLVVAGWLGVSALRRGVLEPRATLLADLASARKQERTWSALLAEQRERVDEPLRGFVDRTLGADLETVDHELRVRLNALGAEAGLGALSVGTGKATARTSPARKRLPRAQRDEPDFVELRATVGGEGTFEQALRLVHLVQSAPWLKHVDQVRLDPRGDGERISVTVRLTTLFVPGAAPRGGGPPPAVETAASFARYRPLVEANPFAERTAPPPAPAAPAPAPSFPYGEWRLTGLTEDLRGPLAWLRHAGTGEVRRLAVGEGLGDAVFVASSGESAEFRLGDGRFHVSIGHTMSRSDPAPP